MSLETGKVYTFKMNSGEEMMGKFIEQIDNYLTIESPVTIGAGPKGMQLIPTLFTVDPDAQVTLNINSVSIYAETEDSIRMKYIEATTGIQVPEKKLILG
jgi:hypothetical protein